MVAAALEVRVETRPRTKARYAGAFFLLTIVFGIVAQMTISDRLVVPGNPATTAGNILASTSLYRLAFTLYLIEMACQIVTTALLYDLLKPVSPSLARAAAAFGYIGCVIKILARLFFYTPLLLLGAPASFAPFDTGQLQSLSLIALDINEAGAAMALVFLGANTLLNGVLKVRATFLPRVLGVLSVLGGILWLSFAWPPLGYRLFPVTALVGLIGSVVTIAYFLSKGVDEPRWLETARASAGSLWR